MKRKFCMIVWGVLLGIAGGYGQEFKPLEGQELRKMLDEIRRISAGIETFECDFIQRKEIAILRETAEAEGRMYYEKPDCLRWEYLQPQAYYFIINKGKSGMRKDGTTDRSGGSRIFGEMGKMILACIRGEKLVDEERFEPAYSCNGDLFRISLRSRSRRLQQIMDVLILEFSVQAHTIQAVEMRQGEDVTRIEFVNKKINKGIDHSFFQWKE